eukprot:CFRG3506T1
MNGALVAAVQFCATEDINANIKVCTRLVTEAVVAGAKLVFLPEAFDYICTTREAAVKLATPLDGPIISHFRALAKENDVWLSLGGFHEQITPAGALGLAICYDVRFPELSLRLRHMGADIICYPSAFAEDTGRAHWEVLLRARAIETQTYVVASAQCGQHSTKRRSYGHTMIINPWGEVVGSMGESKKNSEGICYARVDLELMQIFRNRMPILQHRRADVFGFL